MRPSKNSKHFNEEASPERNSSKIKKRKNKLTDKLGPQWTKGELERFYDAFRKHGRDWNKVAAVVQNNRSVDMVEALFSMIRAYLSLPEGAGAASVAGLVAMMTDVYSLIEESESEGEGHGVSRVSRKHQNGKPGNSLPPRLVMYQKKDSMRSTILKDPDKYIGSTQKKRETRWIYDGQTERMVQREVSYVPGLLKIFDELLVNAADHRQRNDSMTCVMVKINAKQNLITVRNNGIGIPVVKHEEEGVYVPEMLFGQLSTSSNNGKDVKKTIVGRRGYGAKLTNIIGLEDKKIYTTTDSLRYKHVMIMTDQDEDGAHIKGLLINFFHHSWPQLLELNPPFQSEFRTPIIKVKPMHRDGVGARSFYSMFEYEEWQGQQADKLSEWETRHYKGLGTNTSEEGCEYFKHIDNHKRDFVCDHKDHGKAIDRAFNENSGDRKLLLENFDPESHHHETEAGQISFTDFMEKDLAAFFIANIKRSVPSMLDGLKPGQRKILHCLLKRSSNKDIKVSQVSALVSEHCVYHHSDKSLNSITIKMAQDHVGSNNMPLLQSLGQFGTQNAGGKDAAHPRYLRTKLSPETRILFPKEDDEYAFTCSLKDEEGRNREPKRYYPIVPMVLVNGCEGIASGWSTSIPNYKLTDVISNLERLISGGNTVTMDPWYRGFKGTIKEHKNNGYKTAGKLKFLKAETRLVTELPIQVWTDSYDDFLDRGKETRGKVSAFIEDYENRSDDTTVKIQIKLKKTEKKMTAAEETEKLRLTRFLRTSNMYLLDEADQIKKYESPQQIIEEFYSLRLHVYRRRKVRMLMELEKELVKLKCRVSLVTDVMNGEFRFDIKRSYAQLYEEVKK